MRRLWRRYGLDAHQILDLIEQAPLLMEPVVQGTGIRTCKLSYIRENEMVVTLEDFLRRRSKISLLRTHESLGNSQGIKDLCEQLFPGEGDLRYQEYFSAI